MTGRALHAEIAGAGLAGLNAGIALRERGWSVRIHEQASELRMFGAGIWLWENGLRVLRAIGVEEAAIKHAPRVRAWSVRDTSGNELMRRAFGPNDQLFIPPRARVYDALVARAIELGVDIQISSRAVAARGDGTLILDNGTELHADLVVGADGHASLIRESLQLTKTYKSKPDGCTRLMVRRGDDDEWDVATEHWSGHRRILVCPSSDTETYVCLALPVADEAGARVPVDKATWLQSFPHLGGLIERIGDEGRWDVLSLVRCRSWSVGAAAVIGDAAHAQPPNLGQGANLSFANGLALAAHLEGCDDVPARLARWEAVERPLTDHTQRWTNLYGNVVEHWPAGLGGLRSAMVGLSGRSRWVSSQLNRAAHSVPTGAAQ